MKAIRKDFVREVRHTLSRFLSILILVALAVAFLSGLRSTAPDMKNTCDTYMDDQSFMDVQIMATLGITDEDITALRAQPGIAAVEPAYVIDAYAHLGTVDVVTKVYSLPKNLNQLTLLEGRMPQSPNECVVDSMLIKRMGLQVDDTLSFITEGSFKDVLRPDSFTVVGVVRSPLYISQERGNSTLGTGQVSAFAYVPEEALDMDFYTSAFLTVEGAAELPTFSDEYAALIDDTLNHLEPLSQERARLRRESLVDEGNEKLADAETQLEEAKADAKKELEDAWAQLQDARKQLDNGKAELKQAKHDLTTKTADAQKQFADAEVQLKDALAQLEQGELDYLDGKKQYENGLAEYENGLAEFKENEQTLNEGWAQYHDGLAQYEDGLAQLEDARDLLEDGEEQYQEGLAGFDQLAANLSLPGITTGEQLGHALEAEGPDGPTHTALNAALADLHRKADQLADAADRLEALLNREEALNAQIQEVETQLEQLPEHPVFPPFPKPDETAPAAVKLPDIPGLPDWPFPKPEPEDPENPEQPDTPDDPSRPILQMKLLRLKAERDGVRLAIRTIRSQTGMETPQEMRAAVAQMQQLPRSAAEVRRSWAQLQQARKQLDDGWDEYESGRRELDKAKRQLDEALPPLEEGTAQLEEGRKTLEQAKSELDKVGQQLRDARHELDKGRLDYNSGVTDLAEGRAELTRQTADAKVKIADAERDLREGEAEYASGLADYQAGKAEAEEKIADAEDEIGDARRKIADIGDSEWYLLDRESNPGFMGFGQDADRMANLASVFPVLFFLVAALVCLTTMTRMVDEQRVQIGCLKALGYSRWAISRKYLGYGFLPSLLGGILGLLLGFTLFPRMIFTAYQIMYEVPDIQLSAYADISILSLAAAVGCTTLSSLAACMNALRETPAALMRPRAPKAGKRILLEYIKPLWRRMSFSHKVTARNLLRYQKRFWMTVIGIGGCTALIIAGFGLRSSLLHTMDMQYDEIFRYTAQVATVDNLLDSERQAIRDYVDSNPDILDSLPCRITSVTAESATYNTSAYLEVVDPERIHDFVQLRTYRSHEPVPVPDDGVIIDQKTSELLEVGVGDTFVADDGENRTELRVGAINDNYLGHFIYLSPTYYEEAYGKPMSENACLMTFSGTDQELCDEIFTDLMNLHGVVAANRMLSTRDTYTSAMERIDFVVVIVILSAAALALVVLYNLSNINITERRRELATIRVLGFYDGEVSAYVNRENLVLTIFGILFGIGAGRVLHGWLVRSVEIDLMMFGRETDPWAFLWAALLTALFSTIVALMSHQKMKKIDMVESLKSAE